MRNESREFAYVVMEQLGRPRHLVEVGAYRSDHIILLPFIFDKQCRIDLIEPAPDGSRELREACRDFPNIKIWECAIGLAYGEATLMVPKTLDSNPHAGASAYIDSLADSPYLARELAGSREDLAATTVMVRTIDDIDDGTIDGLVIDTEGAEWHTLARLKSRPAVISVEMEGPANYRNPFFDQITQWMQRNHYVLKSVAYVERESGQVPTDYIYVKATR